MKKIFMMFLFIFILLIFTSCKTEEVKYLVEYLATTGGYISGLDVQEVSPSEDCQTVKAVAYEGYEFVAWSDGIKLSKRQDINIETNLSLTATFKKISVNYPSLYINTNNVEITSKEDYVTCLVSVNDERSEYSFTDLSAKIRGRGNSTWGMPKKPYKLKFDKKIDLFGNGKAKTWTLIANYCDESLARNYLMFNLAHLLENPSYTTSYQYVELYLNGSYQGLYLVCEQIEIGESRVEISEDCSSYDTGYLIELDYKVYEDSSLVQDRDYFLVDNIPYGLKEPDPEDYPNTKYLTYIKNYLSVSFETLKNGTYEEVCEYLDVRSFAESYIIQELFKNVDVKHSSWYLYKDASGKLCTGPMWDFDITAGNCNYDNQTVYDFLYAKEYNPWYNYLLKFSEFEELVASILSEYAEMIEEVINTRLDNLYLSKAYFVKNFTKWDLLGKYTWPNTDEMVALKSWDEHVEYLRTWLLKSLEFLKETYQDNKNK